VHSGDAAGVVPSSFRITRQLLSRLEDADTGEVAGEFHVAVPEERQRQAVAAGAALGDDFKRQLPFLGATDAVVADPAELILNRAWRPQLTITGVDGLPSVANAAAVMHPATALKVSLRLPPTVDPGVAAKRVKEILESDPPYRCAVDFRIDMVSNGWHSPELEPWLSDVLERASLGAFGAGTALIGGGGGIPFLAMLGERFPQTQFVVIGVLGPQSNAHGPNEFLHIPTAKRITAVVAHVSHGAVERGGSIQ
jgi:acetylornithine deacetylase/succinyl-diaminopimelate desuccinylase-like protein